MKPCLIIAISIFAVSLSGQAAELTLESCAAIEDPDKRFTCYDTLAARFGDDSLRYSILAGTGFYIIAAFLFFLASRWLERDWED